MKILYTSDWHLGCSLYSRKRYEKFSSFLDWLAQTIEDKKVDTPLVSSDVFDTSTPSNLGSGALLWVATSPAAAMLWSLLGTTILCHF